MTTDIAQGPVDVSVVRLPDRQREILVHIGATCDAGMIWLALGCYGAGDAAAIKALWRKGLAEKYRRTDGNDAGYCSVITQAGRDWLLTHNATFQAAGEGFISPVAPGTTG